MSGVSRGLAVALISVGGAIGVNARYWLATFVAGRLGDRFPWATLAINVSGSLAIGLVATLLARRFPSEPARLALIVGFLGGYTTFSSYSLEGWALWERGEVARALAYLGGSVAAGFVAVAIGVGLGRLIAGPGAVARVIATGDVRAGDG